MVDANPSFRLQMWLVTGFSYYLGNDDEEAQLPKNKYLILVRRILVTFNQLYDHLELPKVIAIARSVIPFPIPFTNPA